MIAQFLCGASAKPNINIGTLRADIDKHNINSGTFLSLAFFRGHAGTAQLLCGAGADVDKHSINSGSHFSHFIKDMWRMRNSFVEREPTLTLTSHQGHAEIAQFLCGARDNIDKPIHKPSINSGSLLLLASHQGHAEIAQFIYRAGAEIDKPR